MIKRLHYIILISGLFFASVNAAAQKKTTPPHNAEATAPDSLPVNLTPVEEEPEEVQQVIEFPGDVRRGDNIVARGDSGTWLFRLQERLDEACNVKLFDTSQLGMCVYDLTDDKLIYALNQRHRMRPASSMKVITSVTGLHYLGGDYMFRTKLYTTGSVIDSTHTLKGDVYVVGSMDPMLDDDDLHYMARQIKTMGIDSIRGHLYMDVYMRKDEPYGWGWCWDDDYGPMSALTFGTKDTFAKNWTRVLKMEGLWLENETPTKAELTKGAKLVTTRHHSIDQVLQPLLKNSNNIYAESMFYNLAAKGGKRNVTRSQAADYVNRLIEGFGLKTDNYTIADGSGLSLYDYITPQLLVRFLRHAWSNLNIRSHFYPALPIAGRDGTLKNRMIGTKAQDNVHAKTGTVTGVSSLTGYCKAPNGHDLAFCIVNMGIVKSSTGRNFQDKICAIMAETK